ncbi:MAG: FHA domain-containing protein [Actinobacteria bacterium]|nr:FHA domain-containing protein [Actinomycetota bacterium]
MTPFALSALKYGLLALVYLFIWRAVRTVTRDLRVASPGGSGRATSKRAAAAPSTPTVVVHGPDGARPRTFKLTASTVLGRAPECEIRLDDTYVSQEHARIFGKGERWYVEDLGSTNGTFVNDQRLAAPAQVEPGDRIRVGTTLLELRR